MKNTEGIIRWGAIALGAVIQGMATRLEKPIGNWSVSTRKATSHMGIEVCSPFNSSCHEASRKYLDPCEGIFMCNNLMSWFVHRGADLSDSEPQTYHFYRYIRTNARMKITEQVGDTRLVEYMIPRLTLERVSRLYIQTQMWHRLTKMGVSNSTSLH
jgi:hypothetical protein